MSSATQNTPDVQHHEHTSNWPIWVGLGIGAMMLSILMFKNSEIILVNEGRETLYTPLGWFSLIVGAALFIYGLFNWVRSMTREHVVAIRNKWAEEFPNIGLWGMLIFIPSEVFLFGSLFASYFVLKAAVGFEAFFDVHGAGEAIQVMGILPALNTIFLVTSSFTLHFAEHFLKHDNMRMFKVLLGVTLALGFLFVGGQILEYYEFIVHEHFDIFSGKYGAMFYSLTGLHGLHVTGGAFFLLYVFVSAFKGAISKERHSVLTSASIYWHFVDVVWLFLMAVIYLRWL